jgi:hypothetical protein
MLDVVALRDRGNVTFTMLTTEYSLLFLATFHGDQLLLQSDLLKTAHILTTNNNFSFLSQAILSKGNS